MALKQWALRWAMSDRWWLHWQRRVGASNATTVLTYHTLGDDEEPMDAWTVVKRDAFLRQVDWLRKHYDVVDLDAVVLAPSADRPRVVLTFDDGHTGWLEQLLPIVKAQALPVTLYVATGHIESGEPYWFDRLMNLAQTANQSTLDLREHGLETWTVGAQVGVANWLVISGLLERLKALEETERHACMQTIEAQWGPLPKRSIRPLAPLTPQNLKELAASTFVTLGSHSDDHRLLDRISLAQARRSVEASKQKLSHWIGRDVKHFAFPNGNFNAALVNCVRELGFSTAATTQQRLFRAGEDDLFSLPRISVGRYDSMDRFKWGLVRA